ncbi:glutaredoxin 3 [Chitinimonas sp. PSY-7]|uniref:glutaredoxin 3 n=1 Tax=Chitinimonas sp. PSY-7 TaxID=3459088 RepID=UPI00403FEDDB
MPKITMYTTGYCPYCLRAEQLLIRKGVTQINKIRIDLDTAERDIMMSRTGRRTVPQIYINERHIGGFDDLAALDHAGELDLLLAD